MNEVSTETCRAKHEAIQGQFVDVKGFMKDINNRLLWLLCTVILTLGTALATLMQR